MLDALACVPAWGWSSEVTAACGILCVQGHAGEADAAPRLGSEPQIGLSHRLCDLEKAARYSQGFCVRTCKAKRVISSPHCFLGMSRE